MKYNVGQRVIWSKNPNGKTFRFVHDYDEDTTCYLIRDLYGNTLNVPKDELSAFDGLDLEAVTRGKVVLLYLHSGWKWLKGKHSLPIHRHGQCVVMDSTKVGRYSGGKRVCMSNEEAEKWEWKILDMLAEFNKSILEAENDRK